MNSQLSERLAELGRKGGKVSSEAKRAAAKRNALKRWGNLGKASPIPAEQLKDRQWYFGKGRSGPFGLWDSAAECFWTIALNEFSNPAAFPNGGIRQARLKKELHLNSKGGTFEPLAEAGPK